MTIEHEAKRIFGVVFEISAVGEREDWLKIIVGRCDQIACGGQVNDMITGKGFDGIHPDAHARPQALAPFRQPATGHF